MNKTLGILTAFFVGTATGITLGILYAPKPGRHTRGKLSYQLSKSRNKLKETLDDLIKGKEEVGYNEAKSQGEKITKDTEEKAQKIIGDMESLLKEVKQKPKAKPSRENN